MLTLPNVRVLVSVAAWPTVLGDGYQDFFGGRPLMPWIPDELKKAFEQLVRERFVNRDWRKLRKSLIKLDLEDTNAVCEWLSDAGYLAGAMLEQPNSVVLSAQDMRKMISTNNLGWIAQYVTPQIRDWIGKYQRVFAWLLTIEHKAFRRAISAAREFVPAEHETAWAKGRAIATGGRIPELKDPVVVFRKVTQAPADLDPHILERCLRGTGIMPYVQGRFLWDHDGSPAVIVDAETPIEAICLSIHIDQNFSLRRWVRCARCPEWFDQIRGRDRFCSAKCRNYFTTRERRKKVKLLIQVEQEWEALSPAKKRRHNQWEWIAASAKRKTKGKVELEPSWVERELAKIRTGGKHGSRKTR